MKRVKIDIPQAVWQEPEKSPFHVEVLKLVDRAAFEGHDLEIHAVINGFALDIECRKIGENKGENDGHK